jgi:hypothetical protein
MAAGLVMQYLWVAWRPNYANAELEAHTALYYTGGLNRQYDPNAPQARDDNYLVILGGFLMLESYTWVQKIFENPVFVWLGRRSLSKSHFVSSYLLLSFAFPSCSGFVSAKK